MEHALRQFSWSQSSPLRHAHGDLEDLQFPPRDGSQDALVDFDTVGQMELRYELGDALRSWTNPHWNMLPKPGWPCLSTKLRCAAILKPRRP